MRLSKTRAESHGRIQKPDLAAEVSNVAIERISRTTSPLVKKYHVRSQSFSRKRQANAFPFSQIISNTELPRLFNFSRKHDIFFRYPWSENDEIEITLPATFALDNADAPADVADPSKIGELKVRIGVDRPHNLLKYSRTFHFGGGDRVLFGSQMYTPLKNLFDAFNTADSHTITLKQM